MALNSSTSSDANWTGLLRVNPKTNNDGTPVAAGVRLPLLTTAERDALAEVEEGTIIYNTTTGKQNVRVASAWEAVTSA